MNHDLAALDRTISGDGTDEASWQGWSGWRAPSRSWDGMVGARLVVVAPHPDDEVLSAGGLMWAAAQAGRPVVVIAVTPGDGSHPGSSRWPTHALKAQRQFERANALAQLGVSDAETVELGVPDGQASERIAEISDRLGALIQPGDTVVCPWRWDGHPDHEATTAAVLQADTDGRARVLQAPIWGWHWADPQYFPADPALLPLDPEARLAKERAVAEYRSQLEPDHTTGAGPVLPSFVLRRFLRSSEVFFDG